MANQSSGIGDQPGNTSSGGSLSNKSKDTSLCSGLAAGVFSLVIVLKSCFSLYDCLLSLFDTAFITVYLSQSSPLVCLPQYCFISLDCLSS